MAFLSPHFEYDVFVSYSHGNPKPRADDDSPLKRWTNTLVHDLETEIQSVHTEFDGLHIWRDEQIDPTIYLTDELRDKVKSSCILMIVMSPRYLVSSWCEDEREWFRQQVQDRQGRVFVVRALPTDESKWPNFLRDNRGHALPGFIFHDAQDTIPYGWRGIRENDEAYVRQLNKLQLWLTKRLRELRDSIDRQEKAAAPGAARPAAGPKKIWLHARAEYAPVREEVEKALKEEGIAPLSPLADPGRTMTDWARESSTRIAAVKHCDALALVRANNDTRFVGDLLEIGVDERQRIQSDRETLLPCAVLDRSGESLPIDVSQFGIERFDLKAADWRTRFRGWLESTTARPAVAS